MFKENSIVILHLHSPKEQFWGQIQKISSIGVMVRAINLNSFEDFLRQLSQKEAMSIDMVTFFVPMHRVEKIYLDEDMGVVPSYSHRFKQAAGITIEEYLGLVSPDLPH